MKCFGLTALQFKSALCESRQTDGEQIIGYFDLLDSLWA